MIIDEWSAVWGRVYSAVECLATSPASYDKRLEFARDDLLPLRPEDFPSEWRNEFCLIMDELKKVKSIKATVDSMRKDEFREIAKRIFSMFYHCVTGDLTEPRR